MPARTVRACDPDVPPAVRKPDAVKARQLIIVVDDDAAIRDGIEGFLSVTGYSCRGYPGVEEMLLDTMAPAPACLILDVMLGRQTDGIGWIPEIRARHPTLPIIIMTAQGDVPKAVRALRAGAADFLEKPFEMEMLTEALERVKERHRPTIEAQQAAARLTERERDVMKAVAQGLSSKEAGLAMGISPRTVEGHRATIMMKLELRSFAELMRVAISLDAVRPRPLP